MKENINFTHLKNGEVIGLFAFKITSIPDISVIGEGASLTDAENEYRLSFDNLLKELYQGIYVNETGTRRREIAVELLLKTEKAVNQQYRAEIIPYIVVRSIASTEDECVDTLSHMADSIKSALDIGRYESEAVSGDTIKSIVTTASFDSCSVITRDASIEPVNSQMLPECYSFDVMDAFGTDMSVLVNSLINHPDMAVSFSLVPAEYTNEEVAFAANTYQVLDTLASGVATQNMGNVTNTLAEEIKNTYRYVQNNRNNPVFKYNILVMGDKKSVDEVSSRIITFMTYSPESNVALKRISVSIQAIQYTSNYPAAPWIASAKIEQHVRSVQSQQFSGKFANLYRLPLIISSSEASGFFRLPIGSDRVNAGLNINKSEIGKKTYRDNLINAGDIEIGKLKSSGKDTIGLSVNDLAKHMLVVGTPGSGKTTFSVSLLDRLWKDHGIPFLVLEPAKNEYRALVESIPDLQIFTPGKNLISPFVYNPFIPPKGVRLETYKSTLKTAFAAAVSMSSPLDQIFEESINNCYSDFMWLDTYTSDDKGKTFNISDFIKCFKETFDAIGYTGDARNIGRAGTVRLSGLVNLFDTYSSIPIEDLLSKPTVIELAAIENSDQKALIISLILLSILAYVNSNYVGEGGLKNVILIEEAHVLLDENTNSGSGDANPSAIAQSLVRRMLAEIRSYGVGLIIADQSPRKVTSDVVALTDIKVAFRIVEAADKQIIADSINMNEAQEKRLSRLRPGEAFLFFNRLEEPEEVSVPDYRLEKNISISLSDDEIGKLSTYWNDRKKMLRPYPECDVISCCKEKCTYERRILAREIARRIYTKNFNSESRDVQKLQEVLKKFPVLVKQELNGEEYSKELKACVKVHFFRKIKYNTKIKVKDIQITHSLEKE